MATPDVLQSPDELLLQSPIGDAPRAGENPKSRGLSIEKKIEFLESLTGAVSTLSDEWRQNSSVNVQFLGVFIVCLSIGICCVSRLVGKFTFPFLIKSCAGLASEGLGMQVHAHVCKFGPAGHLVTENSLIDMYAKFGDSKDAYKVFDDMPQRDAISWNSLISGHVRLGETTRARELFGVMLCKTVVSWTRVISGYSQVGSYVDALEILGKCRWLVLNLMR